MTDIKRTYKKKDQKIQGESVKHNSKQRTQTKTNTWMNSTWEGKLWKQISRSSTHGNLKNRKIEDGTDKCLITYGHEALGRNNMERTFL